PSLSAPRPAVADFLGTVRDGRPGGRERWRQFRGVAVAAGGADGVGRGNDARTGRYTLLDGLLDGDVIVVGGPHIADRGEAGLERFLGIGDPDDSPEIIRELQAAIAAEMRIRGQVSMHVNQT